jgi:hypothetical protein
VYKLPETLEDIVVWKLEHASEHNKSFLYWLQLQDRLRGSGKATRDRVHKWLVRIWPLGVVTSVYIGNSAVTSDYPSVLHKYYRVSVAGIVICAVAQQEHDEIRGETRA